jgi:hypothetical protein
VIATVSSRRGASLMATVLGVALVAVLAAPVLSVTTTSLRAAQRTGMDVAVHLALLDLLDRYGGREWVRLLPSPVSLPRDPARRDLPRDLVLVASARASGDPDLAVLEVSASWTDHAGVHRRARIRELVTADGGGWTADPP